MPIVRVELWRGCTRVQERQLPREVSDAVARVAECHAGAVRVPTSDHAREDRAVDGFRQAGREASLRDHRDRPRQ